MEMTSVENLYWETYDDQSEKDFDLVGYMNIEGEYVVVPISDNLIIQVAEIRRTNGQHTEIRVYKK